jgi:pilus assembly protein Flp/PilA
MKFYWAGQGQECSEIEHNLLNMFRFRGDGVVNGPHNLICQGCRIDFHCGGFAWASSGCKCVLSEFLGFLAGGNLVARYLPLAEHRPTAKFGKDDETTAHCEEVSEMQKRLQKMLRKIKGKSGQSLVEYALILALIAIVAIAILTGIGKSVNSKLSNVNSALQ